MVYTVPAKNVRAWMKHVIKTMAVVRVCGSFSDGTHSSKTNDRL